MRRAVTIAAVILAATGAAAGDMASSKLAKYEKPVDMAIERALAYLASQQPRVGAGEGARRQGAPFNNASNGMTAITSLCVMAFLAKGYTPGVGPYGEVIDRGIDYVISQQNKSGLLISGRSTNGPMYNHGISTLMLSEVSGMVDRQRQERIDEALAKALKLILSAQRVKKKSPNDNGGWRYQATSSDADISCTGWQLMALRSARNNGAPVPKEAIESGIEYILRCRTSQGGYTYQAGRGGPGLGRTGTALLCLELTGQHGDKAPRAAGDYILRAIGATKGGGRGIQDGHFFYATYYASQGMFQLGGQHWEQWAEVMYPTLLKAQRQDGSWLSKHGPTYGTAMAVLAMSVVYRQLPIYQR